MAYVTGCTSRGIRTPTINQSERDYSVRHGVHVTACVRNALCTPLCTSLHTPLHIPAHPSAHSFVHTPLHTPLHIPLCTPLRTSLHTPLCTPLRTSLHTPKKGGRSVPILLLTGRTDRYRIKFYQAGFSYDRTYLQSLCLVHRLISLICQRYHL